MKKAIALLLALMMVLSLAACGDNNPAGGGGNSGGGNAGGGNSGGSNNPGGGGGDSAGGLINFDEDPYEVSIQFVGLFEANNDIAAVEEALNAITVPKINCKVDIVPVFIGDLPTTTSLGVAGGEKLDIVAVGLTSPISTMVKDDLLLPLDDLLAERGPAALEVTKNVAEAQKINGVTYAVTGYPYAARAGGFVYNKAMATEYGIDMHDGMTYEDLSAAGEILKEHGVYLTFFGNSSQLNFKFFNGGEYFGGSSGEYGAVLDPGSSTEVINVFDSQEIRDYFKTVKSWLNAGYLPTGQLTDTNQTQQYLQQGTIFGTSTDYTPNQLASWGVLSDAGIVQLAEGQVFTGSVAEFMLGIAANCKRPDKAMDLINLIYEDADVCNLLMYGVEGLDYVAVEGEENVITRAGTSNEDANGYYAAFVHYGDPLKQKIMAPVEASYYEDVVAFENASVKSLAFGYTFDAGNYGAETAAINNVLAEKLPALNAGEVADVDAAVDDLVAALKTAGIDNVIAANQEQLNAYLGK